MFYSSEHWQGTAVQKLCLQAGSALQGVTAQAVIPPGLSLLDLRCRKGLCHVLAGVSLFVCWVFFPHF